MIKYYTKLFAIVKPKDREIIDNWLNSFYKEGVPFSEYNYKIIGYIVHPNKIDGSAVLITIKVFELSSGPQQLKPTERPFQTKGKKIKNKE